VWGAVSFWAYSSARQILRVHNVEAAVTIRLVRKALTPKNPFAVLLRQVHERADLALSFSALKGLTLGAAPVGVISEEYLQDRREYVLAVWNPSEDPFSGIVMRLQFPYPVEWHQISAQRGVEDVTFRAPAATVMTMNSINGGQVQVLRQPLYSDYELQIAQLRPEGRLELLLVLNSWRDPRGKTIQPHEAVRHFVPESGPEITYIYGSFNLTVSGETIKRDYYAPLILNDDKTVTLGRAGPPPKQLLFRTGME
jgi:hypothetical protein